MGMHGPHPVPANASPRLDGDVVGHCHSLNDSRRLAALRGRTERSAFCMYIWQRSCCEIHFLLSLGKRGSKRGSKSLRMADL